MARDLREYARQTNIRLAVGALALLFLVGDGLIFLIYGSNAAFFGFICLLLGLAPLILVWGALEMMNWLVKRANRD
jgi:hypothetical protein